MYCDENTRAIKWKDSQYGRDMNVSDAGNAANVSGCAVTFEKGRRTVP